MKPETFFVPSTARESKPEFVLIGYIVAGLAAITLLALYWPTAHSIYVIWDRSGTFSHGFVILPVFLWLIWRDRAALETIPVKPFFPAAAAVAVAGFLWLAARLATLPSAEQFALLLAVQLSIITIVGLKQSRRLAFPLAFLFFAVPFGEFLMPWLMERTADVTIVLVKLSGVPVYREANHLQIPSGRWSIVEACSGLRYLVASLVAGVLYAYVRFHSLRRRLAFIALSLAVPLLANWLRAYGIVMLGHLSHNRLGTNIDHIIYGWVFFGFVMTLLFWIGSWWTEPSPPALSPLPFAPPAPAPPKSMRAWPIFSAGVLCLVAGGLWPALLPRLESAQQASTPAITLPEDLNGWTRSGTSQTIWRPKFLNPSAEVLTALTSEGRDVGLYIAYYRNQGGTSKLVSTENTLVESKDEIWRLTAQSSDLQRMPTGEMRVHDALVIGQGQKLAVRQWYWIDGHYTGSQYVAAALILFAKIAGHGDDAAAIIAFTPVVEDKKSSAILDIFAIETAAPLSASLAATRAQR